MRFAICACVVIAVAGLASCRREQRNPSPVAARTALLGHLPVTSELIPGGSQPQPQIASPYQGNAYAISEGRNLFDWFNCSGCHGGEGGGAIGPPLNDKSWIYGGEPAQIFDSIVRGRPNGMPAWGARIPQDRIWQIVAYVRSIAGYQPATASPARTDSIEPNPAEILDKGKAR